MKAIIAHEPIKLPLANYWGQADFVFLLGRSRSSRTLHQFGAWAAQTSISLTKGFGQIETPSNYVLCKVEAMQIPHGQPQCLHNISTLSSDIQFPSI